MTKLSPTQLAILRRLADGERLIRFSPTGVYSWEAKMSTGPRSDSVDKLREAKFVTSAECDWHRAWIIAPAGRAYLEGLE